MEYRTLGRSGLKVSALGLGCSNLGQRLALEPARAVVHKALDLGITLLDTADVYGGTGGSETMLGEILGPRRQDVVLATKFVQTMGPGPYMQGGSRRYVIRAVEASLKRLRTDWIDLYQLHWPDPSTPIEETLRALDDLIRAGKVRYIGTSNFTAWQMVEAAWTAKAAGVPGFVSSQNAYSLLERHHEAEMIPMVQQYGLGLITFFPLGSGLLTGTYARNQAPPAGSRLQKAPQFAERFVNDRNFDLVETLQAFCAARARTTIDLAFSWLMRRPGVSSVIAGASRPEQVEQNVAAASWVLTDAEMDEIAEITGATP